MHRDVVGAEGEHRDRGPADARGEPGGLGLALERRQDDSDQRRRKAELLVAARVVAAGQSPDHRNRRAGARDRSHDAERAGRHSEVERDQARRPENRGQARPEDRGAGRSLAADCDPDSEQRQADRLGDDQDGDGIQRSALKAAEKISDSPRRCGREGERGCEQLLHWPGGRDGVELIRVVEHRSLGGLGRAQVVMHRDSVQELGANLGLERRRPVLDQPQAQVDMAEQAAFVGLPEGRRGA